MNSPGNIQGQARPDLYAKKKPSGPPPENVLQTEDGQTLTDETGQPLTPDA
jgi:hypothetical protein